MNAQQAILTTTESLVFHVLKEPTSMFLRKNVSFVDLVNLTTKTLKSVNAQQAILIMMESLVLPAKNLKFGTKKP